MSPKHRAWLLPIAILSAAESASRAEGCPASQKGGACGVVEFVGKVPARPAVNQAADPFCARTPARDEALVVSGKKRVRDVFVHVVAGAPAAPPVAAAAPAVVVEQTRCAYRPRVQGALVGQAVEVHNGDATLHNVHGYRGTATVVNQAQVPQSPPIRKRIAEVPGPIQLRCDVHPWMMGWIHVVENPHFAVTDDDGRFALPRLPPGRYTLEFWHEKLGTRRAEVEVKEGAATAVQLRFEGAAPTRRP